MTRKRKRKLDLQGITETRAAAVKAVVALEFAGALRLLDRLFVSGDKAPECLLLRSSCQLALSEGKATSVRLPKALKDAEKACERAPVMPEARLCVARILMAQGDPFGAETACVNGIRLVMRVKGKQGRADAAGADSKGGFLWLGSTVKVVGTSRDDLNGQEASVTAYREESGRYCVKLLGGEQEVALKPENLTLPFAAALLPSREVQRRLEETLSEARALADPRREKAQG